MQASAHKHIMSREEGNQNAYHITNARMDMLHRVSAHEHSTLCKHTQTPCAIHGDLFSYVQGLVLDTPTVSSSFSHAYDNAWSTRLCESRRHTSVLIGPFGWRLLHQLMNIVRDFFPLALD